jgi:F0F1-type ATP synthase assembly protein I
MAYAPPPGKGPGAYARQIAVATELPFLLVVGVGIGGVLGYVLDGRFHTKPILMLVLGGLGFFAGLAELLRRLAKEK